MTRACAWLLASFLFAGQSARAEIALPKPDGGTLVLPSPAERIVSLAPNLTELLFAAGAAKNLLATVEYSDYPEAAKHIPRVGDAFRFDLERIIALRPDLVIAWDSGNPEVALQRLESFGLRVWRTEARKPDDIAVLLEAVGRAAGTPETADAAARSYRDRLERLRLNHGGKRPVRFFYQVSERPLFTVTGRHLISQSLSLCGGENVFAAEASLAPQVSVESVLVANPEVLIAPRADQRDDPLSIWQQWPRMDAVRNDAMIYLPADAISRAAPRLLDAVEIACRLMHDPHQP